MIDLWCIAIGTYGIAIGLLYLVVLSVEEADVEDPQGNVTKELYVTSRSTRVTCRIQVGDRGP